MDSQVSQQIVLARPLTEAPVAEDFRLEEAAMPEIGEGELLVRVHVLSLDPYIGSLLRGRHMSGPAPEVGGLIPGKGLGEVIESKAAGFAAGDWIVGETGWRSHAAVPVASASRIDASVRPLSLHLGVAGMPGLTAWASTHHLAKVREGDRVLVSSAAGPVGGTVGQLARIMGAEKVVGIAGGPEKCRMVVEQYGFDDCIDYKQDGWQERIAHAFPDGITVYHENVGGELYETALMNLANYGRVVLCGLAAQYQADERPAGPNPGIIIGKRACVMGLVVYDFVDETREYAANAKAWIEEGRLAYLEDRAEGIENTPALFAKLMRGENIGKTVVQVVPE